jgi:purine-binding chemotaxis protein CheW
VHRIVALPVDDVSGVAEVPVDSVVPPDAVLPGIGHVSGIAALADGLLLIHDLDTFLSIEEERQLAEALEKERG